MPPAPARYDWIGPVIGYDWTPLVFEHILE